MEAIEVSSDYNFLRRAIIREPFPEIKIMIHFRISLDDRALLFVSFHFSVPSTQLARPRPSS